MKVSLRMNLSLLAAMFSIVATLPQVYTTLKTGLLRDHHPYTLGFSLIANILLTIHGYQTRDNGILLFGGWFVIYSSVLLWFKLFRFDDKGKREEDE